MDWRIEGGRKKTPEEEGRRSSKSENPILNVRFLLFLPSPSICLRFQESVLAIFPLTFPSSPCCVFESTKGLFFPFPWIKMVSNGNISWEGNRLQNIYAQHGTSINKDQTSSIFLYFVLSAWRKERDIISISRDRKRGFSKSCLSLSRDSVHECIADTMIHSFHVRDHFST